MEASFRYLISQELLPSDAKALTLEPKALLDMVRRQTGLRQLSGEEDVLEAAGVLMESALKESHNMTFLGKFLLAQRVRQTFCNLLHMADRAHTHPAIRRQQIKQPLFIVGFDRVSVTLTQQLLACDEGNRAPTFSEMLHPFGEHGEFVQASSEADCRLAPAQVAMDLMFGSNDYLNRLGPRKADMAFDDSMILQNSLRDSFLATQFDAPEYESWLSDNSGSEAQEGYAFHKTFLQHLQWQHGCEHKRWLLASTDHVGHLDDILATYPDAKVIFAHRDGSETVAGRCQEVLSLRRGLMSVDASKVAERELHQMATNAKAAADFRRRNPHLKAQFADVTLSDLLKNPVDRVKRLYRKLNLSPLSRRSSQAMWRMVLANRSRLSAIKSVPASIGDFALDEEDQRFDALTKASIKGKSCSKARRSMNVGCAPSFRR